MCESKEIYHQKGYSNSSYILMVFTFDCEAIFYIHGNAIFHLFWITNVTLHNMFSITDSQSIQETHSIMSYRMTITN